MIHLITQPQRGAYRMLWRIDDPTAPDSALELSFARVVAGLSWDPALHYTVVVGERLLESPTGIERYWIVLDEARNELPQPLFIQLIALKDRYRLQQVYAPDNPPAIVESLRRTNGLAHYADTSSYPRAERLWPSFVDFDVTVGLHTEALPDEQAVQRDLERWLTEPLYDPATLQQLHDSHETPLARIIMPQEFPNQHMRTAIEQAQVVPCTALWFALSNLERVPPRPRRWEPAETWEHRPGKGGY